MNELLTSIRADLTDRRLLPVVALVGACLVAAIAYALLGGGSSSTPSATAGAANVPSLTPSTGIAVTGATTERAVAETTDGFKEQSSGKARNPFGSLPGAATASAATSTSTSSTASSTTTSSSSTTSTTESSGSTESGGGSGATEETKTEATKKAKAKPVPNVTVEFGTLPPGITPETAQLTPFTKLKLNALLPNDNTTVLVFMGVTAGAKAAIFRLAEPVLPAGTGTCRPEPTNCTTVDLKPGETEQFETIGIPSTLYELRVLKVALETPSKGKGASAKSASWGVSRAGAELVRRDRLAALPFMRYSSQPGVLVFAPRKAHTARANAAVIGLVR